MPIIKIETGTASTYHIEKEGERERERERLHESTARSFPPATLARQYILLLESTKIFQLQRRARKIHILLNTSEPCFKFDEKMKFLSIFFVTVLLATAVACRPEAKIDDQVRFENFTQNIIASAKVHSIWLNWYRLRQMNDLPGAVSLS
jgi:hypothetical protein